MAQNGAKLQNAAGVALEFDFDEEGLLNSPVRQEPQAAA
jgi:hypothetical protein